MYEPSDKRFLQIVLFTPSIAGSLCVFSNGGAGERHGALQDRRSIWNFLPNQEKLHTSETSDARAATSDWSEAASTGLRCTVRIDYLLMH